MIIDQVIKHEPTNVLTNAQQKCSNAHRRVYRWCIVVDQCANVLKSKNVPM